MSRLGTAEVNFEELGMSVVASSAKNPTLGNSDVSGSIRDIKYLLPKQSLEEDSDDDDSDGDRAAGNAGAGGDGAAGNAGAGSKVKKDNDGSDGSWWPREAFCVKKEAELEKQITKDRDALKEPYELLCKEMWVLLTCLLSSVFVSSL